MKKYLFFTLLSSFVLSNIGQTNINSQNVEEHKATYTAKASKFWITPELRTIEPFEEIVHNGEKKKIIPNNLRRYKHINPNALPLGNDPVWQKTKSSHYNRAPIQNWEGTSFSATPAGGVKGELLLLGLLLAFKITSPPKGILNPELFSIIFPLINSYRYIKINKQ